MPNNPKIKNLNELANILLILKTEGKKIIHCPGVFDLVHLGHMRHLQSAKALGDVLVVTVTTDKYVNKGPGRPIFTQELRAESVAALECVDYVTMSPWPTAVETIRCLKPDIFVYGNEYVQKTEDETRVSEREAVESVGGEIHFTQEITFSSSSLINEYFEVYPEPAQNFLKNFRKRYSTDEVIGLLKGLKKMRVLLIGETILDEYHYVSAIGKPPKGDHIAARFIGEEVHAGGIIACANHMANFCGSVDLITAIGKQDFMEKEAFVRASLKSNVNPYLFFHPTAPTIVKRRYVNQTFLNKLFEIYVIDDRPSPELEEELLTHLSKIFSVKEPYDLVLVLDYGHGLLTPILIDFICSRDSFLAVNAQTNTANAGYNPVTKYRRANYFCLDEPELRIAFQDKYSDINQLIGRLAKHVSLPGAITVTRGHLGSVTHGLANPNFFEVPILSQKIVDTTGAGDAFFAITAPCVAKGIPMDLIPFIGNAVGALAVGYLGNRSAIEEVPLYKFITALLK